MDNTVGRESSLLNKDAYILGLWLADGYWWSSSVGISTTNKTILMKFKKFLLSRFNEKRIKLRVYPPERVRKAKKILFHLYVNSRPLLREFRKSSKARIKIQRKYLFQYFAGRFDGDGSVDRDYKNDFRIVYGDYLDAKQDMVLLEKLGYHPKLYFYKSANTYVVYLRPKEAQNFITKLTPYSVKLLSPRRD